jgi:hypothetical protein
MSDLCDVFRAALAESDGGEERAAASGIRYGHGWYSTRLAHRYNDGSVGIQSYLTWSSVRRDTMIQNIENLLRQSAANTRLKEGSDALPEE